MLSAATGHVFNSYHW